MRKKSSSTITTYSVSIQEIVKAMKIKCDSVETWATENDDILITVAIHSPKVIE